MLQKVGDVEYIFYKQLGGDMIRCDIFKGNISDLEEYKDYEILEFYQNGDRITHYLEPKKAKSCTPIENSIDKAKKDLKFRYRCGREESKRDLYTGKKISSYKTWVVVGASYQTSKDMEIEDWQKELDKLMMELGEKDIFKNILEIERNQPWHKNAREEEIVFRAYQSYSYRGWEKQNKN